MNELENLKQLEEFSLSKLDPNLFKKYVDAMTDIEVLDPVTKKVDHQFFWNFLRDSKLRVHNQFFEDFDLTHDFQLIDESGCLKYHSFRLSLKMKYDLDHIIKTPFDELYERDAFTTKIIYETFSNMLTCKNENKVFNISNIPEHLVKQIGFPDDSYLVQFLRAYPVYNSDKTFFGYVLSLKVTSV